MSRLPELGPVSYLDLLDGMDTSWDAGERKAVQEHNRAAWRRLKREHGAVSVADVPGFLDALQTEWLMGYSLTDIGAIYGVTRERVRQWFNIHGLHHDGDGASYRVWDDELDCFMPVSRDEYRERAREHAERRQEERREERRDAIADAIRDAAGKVRGRPSLADVAREVGIPSDGTEHGPRLAALWDWRVGRSVPYADAFEAMYERAGVPRPRAADWTVGNLNRTGSSPMFTPEEASEIRAAYASGDVSGPVLAERYGCGVSTIYTIVHQRPPYDGAES